MSCRGGAARSGAFYFCFLQRALVKVAYPSGAPRDIPACKVFFSKQHPPTKAWRVAQLPGSLRPEDITDILTHRDPCVLARAPSGPQVKRGTYRTWKHARVQTCTHRRSQMYTSIHPSIHPSSNTYIHACVHRHMHSYRLTHISMHVHRRILLHTFMHALHGHTH